MVVKAGGLFTVTLDVVVLNLEGGDIRRLVDGAPPLDELVVSVRNQEK